MDMKQRIIDFIEANPNLDLKEMSLSLNKSGLKLGPQAYWNPIKLKKFMLENPPNTKMPFHSKGAYEANLDFEVGATMNSGNKAIIYADELIINNNKQNIIKNICDLNLNEEQFIAVVKAILGE